MKPACLLVSEGGRGAGGRGLSGDGGGRTHRHLFA